jgi:prepilin-type N-terminal cleavage/methylation domain-containing protein
MAESSGKMVKKYGSGGFTLFELLIVISIVGIFSSLVIVNFRQYIKEKTGEVQVVTLFKELSGIRAKAMKYDSRYIINFVTTDTPTIKIYRDKNSNNIGDATEKDSSLYNPKITFGFPCPKPASGPHSASISYLVDGAWHSTGSMHVERDNICSIDNGSVYLNVPAVPKIGYCILTKIKTQTLQLYKWTGAVWIEM